MSTLKLGQEVTFKSNSGYTGYIVAFYTGGTYAVGGEMAVVAASNRSPFEGPHVIIHTSLLEPQSEDGTRGIGSISVH